MFRLKEGRGTVPPPLPPREEALAAAAAVAAAVDARCKDPLDGPAALVGLVISMGELESFLHRGGAKQSASWFAPQDPAGQAFAAGSAPITLAPPSSEGRNPPPELPGASAEATPTRPPGVAGGTMDRGSGGGSDAQSGEGGMDGGSEGGAPILPRMVLPPWACPSPSCALSTGEGMGEGDDKEGMVMSGRARAFWWAMA